MTNAQETARRLARHLAFFFLYYLFRYRRGVVFGNLAAAFPELTAPQRNTLARQYYRHLARLVLEVGRTRAMPPEAFTQAITLVNPEAVRAASDNFSRSIIFLGIHQGNWEWMLHATAQALGIAIDPIYKPLHNRRVNQFMHALRSQFHGEPIPAERAGQYVLRHRRKFCAIAILADQSPMPEEASCNTRFLGRETAFHAGFAQLAALADARIVFTQCHCADESRYNVEFFPLEETGNGESRTQALVDAYAAHAERAIRAQPHTWLWSHRRWKRQA